MPEGDTVHLAAARLKVALESRVLTKTDLRVPRFATVDLSGRSVLEVLARGKHLLFRLEGGRTIHSHFRMDGSWHLYRRGERWKCPAFEARAVLENEVWQAVGFRLPVLEVLPTEQEEGVVGHLGPDVLGPDWDAGEVRRRIEATPERSLGEVLLDQRILAGVGNVYKSEICFMAGLHPMTPIGLVTDLPGVIDLTKRLMEANRTTGRQITTGDPRPGRSRWVYGRSDKPCRRCATPVRQMSQSGYGGERVTFWCPRCQPVTTPRGVSSSSRAGSSLSADTWKELIEPW